MENQNKDTTRHDTGGQEEGQDRDPQRGDGRGEGWDPQEVDGGGEGWSTSKVDSKGEGALKGQRRRWRRSGGRRRRRGLEPTESRRWRRRLKPSWGWTAGWETLLGLGRTTDRGSPGAGGLGADEGLLAANDLGQVSDWGAGTGLGMELAYIHL